jgi:hypothetical protein
MKRAAICAFWLFSGSSNLIWLAHHRPFLLPGFALPYWVSAIVAASAFFLLGVEMQNRG